MTKEQKQACILIGIGVSIGLAYAFAPAVLPLAKANAVRSGIIKAGSFLLS